MRFFASWWERFPRSQAAALVAVAVAFGMSTQAPSLLQLLVSPGGFGWA